MDKPHQIWINENIDLIMRIVLKINPTRKGKEAKHRTWRSETRSKFKESMDSPSSRPYYYLARHKQEEDRLFKIIKKTKEDRDLYKKHLNAWVSKYETAQKKMKDEFGENSKEYKRVFR